MLMSALLLLQPSFVPSSLLLHMSDLYFRHCILPLINRWKRRVTVNKDRSVHPLHSCTTLWIVQSFWQNNMLPAYVYRMIHAFQCCP